jgi:chromosome segregation ATPase
LALKEEGLDFDRDPGADWDLKDLSYEELRNWQKKLVKEKGLKESLLKKMGPRIQTSEKRVQRLQREVLGQLDIIEGLNSKLALKTESLQEHIEQENFMDSEISQNECLIDELEKNMLRAEQQKRSLELKLRKLEKISEQSKLQNKEKEIELFELNDQSADLGNKIKKMRTHVKSLNREREKLSGLLHQKEFQVKENMRTLDELKKQVNTLDESITEQKSKSFQEERNIDLCTKRTLKLEGIIQSKSQELIFLKDEHQKIERLKKKTQGTEKDLEKSVEVLEIENQRLAKFNENEKDAIEKIKHSIKEKRNIEASKKAILLQHISEARLIKEEKEGLKPQLDKTTRSIREVERELHKEFNKLEECKESVEGLKEEYISKKRDYLSLKNKLQHFEEQTDEVEKQQNHFSKKLSLLERQRRKIISSKSDISSPNLTGSSPYPFIDHYIDSVKSVIGKNFSSHELKGSLAPKETVTIRISCVGLSIRQLMKVKGELSRPFLSLKEKVKGYSRKVKIDINLDKKEEFITELIVVLEEDASTKSFESHSLPINP